MSANTMMEQLTATSTNLKARIAGVFYLLTIAMGIVVFATHGSVRFAADVIATACYIAVAVLLFDLFKSVNTSISLLAACCSLAGLAAGKLWPRSEAVEFIFIGFYCLLIGYLIFRSTFLPRILAVLMAFAGLAYLTFLSPALVKDLFPYNLAPGAIGQISLCLWLLVMGVHERRR